MRAEAGGGASGQIFLSYRRDAMACMAGRVDDRLAKGFGDGDLIQDVDSIELGDDFAQPLVSAVRSCEVLVTLIGDRWRTGTGANGARRWRVTPRYPQIMTGQHTLPPISTREKEKLRWCFMPAGFTATR